MIFLSNGTNLYNVLPSDYNIGNVAVCVQVILLMVLPKEFTTSVGCSIVFAFYAATYCLGNSMSSPFRNLSLKLYTANQCLSSSNYNTNYSILVTREYLLQQKILFFPKIWMWPQPRADFSSLLAEYGLPECKVVGTPVTYRRRCCSYLFTDFFFPKFLDILRWKFPSLYSYLQVLKAEVFSVCNYFFLDTLKSKKCSWSPTLGIFAIEMSRR